MTTENDSDLSSDEISASKLIFGFIFVFGLILIGFWAVCETLFWLVSLVTGL